MGSKWVVFPWEGGSVWVVEERSRNEHETAEFSVMYPEKFGTSVSQPGKKKPL
jgi:hypothetical protein